MTFRSFQIPALLLALIAPTFLSAQETTANEDERIEQLVRSEASEWYTPKNSVTVGFRVLTSGVKVHFGNLGSVFGSLDITSRIAPPSAGATVKRTYDNGFVDVDAPRSTEVDANGNQTSTPGGRFQTYTSTSTPQLDANGNVIGTTTTQVVASDSLSYTPGLTRVWSYSTPDQATAQPGYIAMSSYSATSEGGAYDKKQGPSAGVELQFSHALRKLGKKSELSFIAGIGLNGINNKTAGDVHSTLHTYTDYYSLNGLTAPVTNGDIPYPYTAPYIPDGTTETTVPISAVSDPKLNTQTAAPGAATVHGRWQVKGAYFMVKLGPAIRTQLTERLGLSASAGVAGAYVGTHYSAIESMEIPILGTTVTDTVTDSDESKFLGGYYADFNVEWATNDTLGLFGGVSAQKFGDYTQTLGDRNARIDLGSSLGLRGGVNIKF